MFAIFSRYFALNYLFAIIISEAQVPKGNFKNYISSVGGQIHSLLNLPEQCDQIAELCSLFLGEKIPLSGQMREDFQNSGLSHIIAISAGQISPFLSSFCLIFGLCILFSSNNFRYLKNSRCLFFTANTIVFFTAACAAIFFGMSGALLRLPTLWFFEKLWSGLTPSDSFVRCSVGRWVGLYLLCIFVNHPFQNLSFALSALGAECALFTSSAIRFLHRDQKSKVLKSFYSSVTTTIGVSLLMSILLAPCTYSWKNASHHQIFKNFINTSQSNALAVPLATFIIAPLAFLKLVFTFFSILLSDKFTDLTFPLDSVFFLSLKTLANIAALFSHGVSSSYMELAMYAKNGYFLILIVTFWAMRDAKNYFIAKNFRLRYLSAQ